jgi:hypothetical protein
MISLLYTRLIIYLHFESRLMSVYIKIYYVRTKVQIDIDQSDDSMLFLSEKMNRDIFQRYICHPFDRT